MSTALSPDAQATPNVAREAETLSMSPEERGVYRATRVGALAGERVTVTHEPRAFWESPGDAEIYRARLEVGEDTVDLWLDARRPEPLSAQLADAIADVGRDLLELAEQIGTAAGVEKTPADGSVLTKFAAEVVRGTLGQKGGGQ